MSEKPGVLQKTVLVEGRYNRAEYLVSMLVFGACVGVAEAIPITGLPLVLTYIAAIFLSWVAVVRRLHDLGWSGWWSLTSLVPVANFVMGVLVAFKPGQAFRNQYDEAEAALYDYDNDLFLSREKIHELAKSIEEKELARAIEEFNESAGGEQGSDRPSEECADTKSERVVPTASPVDHTPIMPVGRLVMTASGMYCVDDGLVQHRHGKGRGATRGRQS